MNGQQHVKSTQTTSFVAIHHPGANLVMKEYVRDYIRKACYQDIDNLRRRITILGTIGAACASSNTIIRIISSHIHTAGNDPSAWTYPIVDTISTIVTNIVAIGFGIAMIHHARQLAWDLTFLEKNPGPESARESLAREMNAYNPKYNWRRAIKILDRLPLSLGGGEPKNYPGYKEGICIRNPISRRFIASKIKD